MKKYYAPICDITVVHSHDVIAMSGYEEELKFGAVFELVPTTGSFDDSES